MVEWQSADQKVRGLIPRSAKNFSIYLNKEFNQKVKKNKNNGNSSNSLVFGH